jgi:hypothetical protein
MEIYVTTPNPRDSEFIVAEEPAAGPEITRFWWLWLVFGIAWIVASLVILQFDQASIAAVGIIVGIMFAVAAAQQLVVAVPADRLRWLWALFGGLLRLPRSSASSTRRTRSPLSPTSSDSCSCASACGG